MLIHSGGLLHRPCHQIGVCLRRNGSERSLDPSACVVGRHDGRNERRLGGTFRAAFLWVLHPSCSAAAIVGLIWLAWVALRDSSEIKRDMPTSRGTSADQPSTSRARLESPT